MNGRIYDPLLGRFFSADLIVQSPGSLQSFNRYSFVLNNPLTHTDPTGFSVKLDKEPTYGDMIIGPHGYVTYIERGGDLELHYLNINIAASRNDEAALDRYSRQFAREGDRLGLNVNQAWSLCANAKTHGELVGTLAELSMEAAGRSGASMASGNAVKTSAPPAAREVNINGIRNRSICGYSI